MRLAFASSGGNLNVVPAGMGHSKETEMQHASRSVLIRLCRVAIGLVVVTSVPLLLAALPRERLEHRRDGASAVQVGTANFLDPACMVGILDGLAVLLTEAGTSVEKVSGHLLRQPEGAGS